MKHTKTQQGPVEALNVLIDNYQPLIKGNKILKEDVDLLKRNLEAQASCYDMQCKYLLYIFAQRCKKALKTICALVTNRKLKKMTTLCCVINNI